MDVKAIVYKIIRFFTWLFYPHIKVVGRENLPDEPCIVVGNHAKMNGPIGCELYFPGKYYIWTAGEMMNVKDVPAYAYKDFWGGKPAWCKWFFKLLSYFIAPLAVCIFNNAHCIGVYHDMRVMSTFRETIRRLQEGTNIIIFPEHYTPHNNVVWEFQDRFIDVAKMYYKRTGKDLSFVPLYTAPNLRSMFIGKPVKFNHEADFDEERKRIINAMMDGVTALAEAQPVHTVVPYPNIPKKDYPINKDTMFVKKDPTPRPKHFTFGPPVVDYRQFRFSKLRDSEFKHLRLLEGWIVYFIFYFLTENLIPESRLHLIHCALDDVIPFNEYFFIFYCFWYVLIVISLLYFALYDIDSFCKLQKFIIITQVIAMIVYIAYPSVQDLRPEVMPRDNFFCHVGELIYWFDTPTGVFPSLHVAYSLGIASVWLKDKKVPDWWKVFVVISCFMISISVMFVKQHSALDVLSALLVSAIAEYMIFGRLHAARRRYLRWRARKLALRIK